MKKKIMILSLLLPLLVIGCSTSDEGSSGNVSSSSISESETSSEDSSGSQFSSSEGSVHVKSVSLDQTSLVFYQDDPATTLTATVLPEDAENKDVTWSSNNTSVATVNNGKITPVSPGNATITVKTVDGKKTATCRVSVSFPDYVLHGKFKNESGWIDKPMIYNELSTAEYMLLGVQLYKDDVFSIHMYGNTWYGASDLKSSVPSGIVTDAGSDNNIKVLTTDTYDIYSSYNESDGGHIYIASSGYTPTPGTVHVDEIMLNRSGKYLQYRYEYQLTANIYPGQASNKKVYWSSSDESVATVTQGGRVVAKSKTGSTIITARTEDGNKTDTCQIYVAASDIPPYYLRGTIGGRSISSYAYAALPLSNNEYFIPNVDLSSGDRINVMFGAGSYVHAGGIGNPIYVFTSSESKSVNMYLTITSKDTTMAIGSLSAVNRASRDIYVKYPSDTNNDDKCGWIWVSGPDIISKWIKSSSLISGSTGSKFNISKYATQFTFVRANKNQTPSDYSSIAGVVRTVGPFNINDAYEYDAS